MKEMWVVVVDGDCYGFFNDRLAAIAFAASDFPVAFAAGNYSVYEFVSV